MNVYLFGWPTRLVGREARIAHLLRLLREHCQITVVPNDTADLANGFGREYLQQLGIAHCLSAELPNHLSGIALAISNPLFFSRHLAHLARDKGLAVLWSPDALSLQQGEVQAIAEKMITKVLFVSDLQKSVLGNVYRGIGAATVGAYLDPSLYPFHERRSAGLTVGSIGTGEPLEYSLDYPTLCEAIQAPNLHFRILGWDEAMQRRFGWHRFDQRWDLVSPAGDDELHFLSTIDVYLYSTGHSYRESWKRSVLEAMLTGCIPFVPREAGFEAFIEDGKSGFLCSDFRDYQEATERLCKNPELRSSMAQECRATAERVAGDRDRQLAKWLEVLQ